MERTQSRQESTQLRYEFDGNLANPFARLVSCVVGGIGIGAPVGYAFNGKHGAINGAFVGALSGFSIWLFSESVRAN